MPSKRIAICFDGRIIIHDHIPTDTLSVLSPLPHVSYSVCFVPCAFLVIVRPSIHLYILFVIHFLPEHTRFLCFTPTTTSCDTHSFHMYFPFPISPLPFPTIPSTALRSEYPLKFQKWNCQISSHESFTMLGFELCMLTAGASCDKTSSHSSGRSCNFTDPTTQNNRDNSQLQKFFRGRNLILKFDV